jgi:ferrous iron transport protein A
MMPLTIVKNGEASYIKRITGKDEVRHRLAEMGFVTGECVTVVSKIGGNMILTIKGTRVALDKNMAGRIMV